MKREKSCQNCLKSKFISINGDFLCSLKGVVTADYYCSKYKSMDIQYFNSIFLKCADCNYFVQKETSIQGNIGVCRLFTERLFNGSYKKACSKIQLKSSSEELSAI